jgi:site-specific recombinase XerD
MISVLKVTNWSSPAAGTIHHLRHISVPFLLAAGVDPTVVQKRLGHSSIQLTMNIYCHSCRRCRQTQPQRLIISAPQSQTPVNEWP